MLLRARVVEGEPLKEKGFSLEECRMVSEIIRPVAFF